MALLYSATSNRKSLDPLCSVVFLRTWRILDIFAIKFNDIYYNDCYGIHSCEKNVKT